MGDKDKIGTTDIRSKLFWHLYNRGSTTDKINQFVREVFNILGPGGMFTVGSINHELEKLGWGPEALDDEILEMILDILREDFEYKISSHTVH